MSEPLARDVLARINRSALLHSADHIDVLASNLRQLAAADATGLLDLVGRAHRQVDRDGEADAHVAARRREDLRIDAYHFTTRVQ